VLCIEKNLSLEPPRKKRKGKANKELTGKVVIERSKKGPGFDYWLGEDDDDLLFYGKARLEISGLLLGSQSKISTRVKQKKNQIKASDHLAPGYVAVVEFGEPTAHVEVK
jgi:hypothetical protein